MRKNHLILLIAGVLAVGLLAAGCGSSDDSSTTEVTEPTSTATTTESTSTDTTSTDTTTTDTTVTSGGASADDVYNACVDAISGHGRRAGRSDRLRAGSRCVRQLRQAGRGRGRRRRRHRAGALPAGGRPGGPVAAGRGRLTGGADRSERPGDPGFTASRSRPLSRRDVEPHVVELGLGAELRHHRRRELVAAPRGQLLEVGAETDAADELARLRRSHRPRLEAATDRLEAVGGEHRLGLLGTREPVRIEIAQLVEAP